MNTVQNISSKIAHFVFGDVIGFTVFYSLYEDAFRAALLGIISGAFAAFAAIGGLIVRYFLKK